MNKIFPIFFFIFLFLSKSYAQNNLENDQEKVYYAVQEKASPIEGFPAFAKKFTEIFDINNIATKDGILKIRIQFIIEKDGSFNEITIKDDEYNLIDEVKRVFSLMPNWKPAVVGDKIVRSKFTLPLTLNVDLLELPKISFNNEYQKALKSFDVDNEYFSFSCNCNLSDKAFQETYAEVIFDYKAIDDSAVYRIEVINKSNFDEVDLVGNFEKSFQQSNGNVKDGVFKGKKIRLLELQTELDGMLVYQKGIINQSKDYVVLAYVITPYENGINVLFDDFLNSLTIKK